MSVMRSTAGLASYMNHPQVRESFITQSNCMKTEWNTWYTSYSQQSGVAVANGINTIYTDFIQGVMKQFSNRLISGMDDMIAFWEAAVANPNVTVRTVGLNWGTLIPSTAGTLNADGLDLSPLKTYISRNGVTWWGRL
ncbi:hypothetical protein C8R46DRAFT_1356073 [Mycena filopes]|nr:hypothetical protein C8R46DRAFT_1356073 [Mycena filopes]